MNPKFTWHPSTFEIIPFNARYPFPSQNNKTVKTTPRIPPKNDSTFDPGSTIRLEFPAQGYLNPSNTTLEFDVQLIYTPQTLDYSQVRFQNNIQSLFSRVRLLYGSTPIEDIVGYNCIVRQLTEWLDKGNFDQRSINEGIGGIVHGEIGNCAGSGANSSVGNIHVRKNLIHGFDLTVAVANTAADILPQRGSGNGSVPNGPEPITIGSHTNLLGCNPVRRYQVQLALGMFNQEKLIPTKFMASQLAIEITLATAAECIIFLAYQNKSTPTYQVSNVNLIPEILEFDVAYDEAFIKGLINGGVPIKFATWRSYQFQTGGAASFNLQIPERARSVKSLFCLQRDQAFNISFDSHACFFTTDTTKNTSSSTSLCEYQLRIDQKYFPASPVQCSTEVGGSISNGGAEAWVELAKALKILGKNASSITTTRWAVPPGGSVDQAGGYTVRAASNLNRFDYGWSLAQYGPGGIPFFRRVTIAGEPTIQVANSLAGNMGSSCFAMGFDLETGTDISGINTEEQSDISLIIRYSAPQNINMMFEVFTFIDAMIILRENNVNPFNVGDGINDLMLNCMSLLINELWFRF